MFKISKWLHKYVGLLLLLFLMWMSATGVLLNHPDLISGISVPGGLIPSRYHLRNWNRGALINLLFSEQHPDTGFAGGRQGVWITKDGGRTFAPLQNGFPESRYYRKTQTLFYLESDSPRLFAGTGGGLYACRTDTEHWEAVPLGKDREQVRKILRIRDRVVVFTRSHVYASPLSPEETDFQPIPFSRDEDRPTVSLLKTLFGLHDGSLWGLPGKLLSDAAGVILFFLSISACYIWYYPKGVRRRRKAGAAAKTRAKALFRFCFRYHLRLGIWTAAILLIIAGTGLFMRPPLVAVIVGKSLPATWYTGGRTDNPWHDKIRNALYDPVADTVVVQASDGVWTGPSDFSRPFVRTRLPVPIFAMGALVFDACDTGGYRVGSFSGLYHLERETGRVTDMTTGRPGHRATAFRPGRCMATGYFRTPGGEAFVNDYRTGLLPLGDARFQGRFNMPPEMTTGFRMSLWNYLFEIHNGRFFAEFIGNWHILIIPLGSILFLLLLISGTYDWLYVKVFRRKFQSR
ncbi:PepSY domain-containing protein [Desulfonema ishimotonii]|uniref:PepSY domain-containing protein n=2 Tax=Desulfonema ishimotonii TaxID=45657 RepID=A0A401FZJ0_9BACT|nr:PepSY domain-containing protein [Desulfonema ishimotonii]